MEATVEGEKRGYEWGNNAVYALGRSVGFREGYGTHKEEMEEAWFAARLTNDELRVRHQEWMSGPPPEDPLQPDLRHHEIPEH